MSEARGPSPRPGTVGGVDRAPPAERPTQTLVGRERELTFVLELLDAVVDRGGTLAICGDPGVGKTALLEAAAEHAAARGMGVLATTGVPAESHMAFAGLYGLVGGLLDGVDRLPGQQRDALLAAFGLLEAGAPDPFLIALAVLDLLSDAAEATPLLLLVEDAHWLDDATWSVLAFVGRRIEHEQIALLAAFREGLTGRLDASSLPVIRLAPLLDPDDGVLLDRLAPGLPVAARRRILDQASGNPLALRELARAVESHGTDDRSVLDPLPMTDRLERAFADRLGPLPEPTRVLLLVAALDEGGSLGAQLEAATSLTGQAVTVDALVPAEQATLVEVGEHSLRFRHPLIRAGIAGAAPHAARLAAHAALGAAYADDPDRAVWHRAAGQMGPDDGLATELEAAAARAARRGAPAIAAASLERAARLAGRSDRRGSTLVRAAGMHLELGDPERAFAALRQAAAADLPPADRAWRSFLLESCDERSWAGPERVASFAAMADETAQAVDPQRGLAALQAAALRCWWGNPSSATRTRVLESARRLPVAPDEPALLAVLAFANPVECAADVIRLIAERPIEPDDPPEGLHLVGTAATAVWAFDRAGPYLDAAVEGLRRQGRLTLLAQALVSQAWAAVHLANPTRAAAAAEEAARLADETGQQRWSLGARLVSATVAAERGDHERAEAIAREAEAVLVPQGTQPMLALVQFARGRGAVAHHRYDEGHAQLSRILDPSDAAYHPFVGAWGLADMAEAAAGSGRPDDAERALSALAQLAARTGSSFLTASLTYATAVTASGAGAGPHYDRALASDLLTGWPCFRSRLLLAYGRWLRRQRRAAESRVPLRAARDSFDALGLYGLSESARKELRASGETSMRREPDARDALTAQELQIAELAARGLSNREIGRTLYISHRTVGSHLYRIFPKLGITSRAQLAFALPSSAGIGSGDP